MTNLTTVLLTAGSATTRYTVPTEVLEAVRTTLAAHDTEVPWIPYLEN